MSMMEISKELGFSVHKVAYWMAAHNIKRRTISDAVYTKYHPKGDPFKLKTPVTADEWKLLGLGIGLYWGEGTKANQHSVRLGNTDPELIKTFIEFLIKICGIKFEDLKFGLQLFTDINSEEALRFWMNQLNANRSQFYKITVSISGSIGNYRQKSKYGVLTVMYHNRKLRDILVAMLPR